MGSLYISTHYGRGLKKEVQRSREFQEWKNSPEGAKLSSEWTSYWQNQGDTGMMYASENGKYYFTTLYGNLDPIYDSEMISGQKILDYISVVEGHEAAFSAFLQADNLPDVLKSLDNWTPPGVNLFATS